MIFNRIVDNELHNLYETDTIGFDIKDPSYIPDEYLERQKFVIMRTAQGIGDWGVISAMPRLLKQKYPECKVYIPSSVLLDRIYGTPYEHSQTIFYGNPYIDGFCDGAPGDIFHDQYRVYDNDNIDTPLVEQMLKFWQFEEHEYADSQPELYWSQEEKQLGDHIISKFTDGEYGCLLLSQRLGTQNGKPDEETYKRDVANITKVLKENDLPYFYWSSYPLDGTPFNFINKALNIRHINIRVQLYIKARAKLNISNQCGTNHLVVRYSNCIESQRQFPLAHNFVKGEVYL